MIKPLPVLLRLTPEPNLTPHTVSTADTPVPLAQAAVEIQLAVDLIMLLEQQQLPPAVILAALEIVQQDFQRALLVEQQTATRQD
ncbi:DUF2496 domain-containing protein [Rheinheimera riviphila]|uniref:DUF2496 domain-containing protein n=1 Tax=Rheinheimera riviphila TaxID=1834037 RepID=A0A437R189_9GAMM|nr:DUF2496 domain-containing protein [Rheinheimera riviphila]RVU40500.1 DUF2496 domain-containing protein [Rheinheimera riviphila]